MSNSDDVIRPESDRGSSRASGVAPHETSREVAALHSMSEHVRAVFGSSSDQRAFTARRKDGSPTGLEQAMWVRELLHATAARVERLAKDARPVHLALHSCEPIAGYYRWSSEDLAASIAAEADHLASLTRELGRREDLAPESRHALLMLAAQFLADAVRKGEEHVRQAELSG